MTSKLEIEFDDDGETVVWEGWQAQLIWPLVRLAIWFRCMFRGGKLTIKKEYHTD